MVGKKVVLTGAGSGIGLALLELLLQEGPMEILAVDLQIAKLEKYKNRIEIIQCDIGDQASIDVVIDEAVQRMGGIDLFIANAGYGYYEKIESPSWQHIESIFAVNVFSPIYSLEKMAELCGNANFTFVTTVSVAGKMPLAGYSLYSGTRLALDGFLRAYEYEKQSNMHIMRVYPIATKTQFFRRSGIDVVPPWPSQSPVKVARAMINGIKTNKKAVYPSWSYRLMAIMDRFLFFIFPLYGLLEKRKFKQWLDRQE